LFVSFLRWKKGLQNMSDSPPNDPAPDSEMVLCPSTAAPHPEEMRGTVRLRIGKSVAIDATGRVTPAGLVTLGLLITAIAVPLLIIGKRSPGRSRS
jgi:hypothetical protein